jgi:hypothetical protein
MDQTIIYVIGITTGNRYAPIAVIVVILAIAALLGRVFLFLSS